MTLNDPSNGGWVIDIEATGHVHSDVGILKYVCNNAYTPNSMFVGNGSAILVTTSGHTNLSFSNTYHPLHLQNVLITPNIIKTLIFVCKFTTHNNCFIDFDPFGFTILDY